MPLMRRRAADNEGVHCLWRGGALPSMRSRAAPWPLKRVAMDA